MSDADSVPHFLAIVGPTGTGKTSLSLLVAEALDGEVISMDSRQIYRGMNIGTAKVSVEDRERVPHHGLDIRKPDERYSAGQFGRDARRWIAAIRGRERVPILVGGTGFFLKVLTEPIAKEPPAEPERKAALERFLVALAVEELTRWVKALDPTRAEVATAGGRQRLVRTLVVTLMSGRPLSWWHKHGPTEGPPLLGVVCVLDLPAALLQERIEARVRTMIATGLADEVAGLLAAGYNVDDPGLNAVAYREFAQYLLGKLSLERAADLTVAATRRYARRQRTWFRGQSGPNAVTVDGTTSPEAQLATVVAAWQRAA